MNNFRNWFIHKFLRVPYQLFCRLDQGKGQTVVLLHGIGSSAHTWDTLARELEGEPVRVMTFDLLGFGGSPKPTDSWVTYSAQDQARAVIQALKRRRVKGPVTLVGHSMGCFVAVEVAALRPKMVRSLILYEPPFYVGLPPKNAYRLRLRAYFALFNAVLRRPVDDPGGFRRIQRLVSKRFGFELTDATWTAFERSLRNAIMQQTAVEDLRKLTMPVKILYGRFDEWVVNDKQNVLFENANGGQVSVAQVAAQHHVSPKASRMLAELIRQTE
jgi:pimeloyl-ACP methyl ester carboxylesterase